jgi:hypothetical protein
MDAVRGTLEGHADYISTVVFSPDVRITIPQKQTSLKDPALKSWRPFWAHDILGLQKWKGRIDEKRGQ